MTNSHDSPVTRLVRAYDGTEYVVTLSGGVIEIRQKGKRAALAPVPVGAIYSVAAKITARSAET
jgi:hypothetical protein